MGSVDTFKINERIYARQHTNEQMPQLDDERKEQSNQLWQWCETWERVNEGIPAYRFSPAEWEAHGQHKLCLCCGLAHTELGGGGGRAADCAGPHSHKLLLAV